MLGISLQMNVAPRSAVFPPGTLVNVGMFAATKCLENRILRLRRSPPPSCARAVDCAGGTLILAPDAECAAGGIPGGGQAYEDLVSANRNRAREIAAKVALIASSIAVGSRTPKVPLPERMMERKPRMAQ